MHDDFQISPAQREILERYPALFERPQGSKGLTLLDDGLACDAGWYQILDRLFADLSKIQKEDILTHLRVVEVKEKFGRLRVYVVGGNERVDARIEQAVDEASATCEGCGGPSPGFRYHGAWYGNICDSCARERRADW